MQENFAIKLLKGNLKNLNIVNEEWEISIQCRQLWDLSYTSLINAYESVMKIPKKNQIKIISVG